MAASPFSQTKLREIIKKRGGFTTSERFQVIFTPGTSAKLSGLGLANQELSYLVENVALPTKSISGVGKMIYGLEYQMPYRQSYPEVAMTFYCTKNMAEKKTFDQWQNYIINPHTGDLSFHDDYTCDIRINKFHKDATNFNSPVYSIILQKAWPSIVAEVQLTHTAGNELTRLPVTFQYKKWRTIGTETVTRRAAEVALPTDGLG